MKLFIESFNLRCILCFRSAVSNTRLANNVCAVREHIKYNEVMLSLPLQLQNKHDSNYFKIQLQDIKNNIENILNNIN